MIQLIEIILAVSIPIGLIGYYFPNCLDSTNTKKSIEEWWSING